MSSNQIEHDVPKCTEETLKDDSRSSPEEVLAPAKMQKYQNMLKIGLPIDIIRHRMKMDGVSESHLLAALGNTNDRKHEEQDLPNLDESIRAPQVPLRQLMARRRSSPVPKPPPPSSLRKKKLFWEPLSLDKKSSGGGFWTFSTPHMTTKKEPSLLTHRAPLGKLFTLQGGAPPPGSRSTNEKAVFKGGSVNPIITTLLDRQRGQNIAITLARVKVPFETIHAELREMTTSCLTALQLRTLMDLWPPPGELARVRAYVGELERLGTAERFVAGCLDFPDVPQLFACLCFELEFQSQFDQSLHQRHVMHHLIRALRSSNLLQELCHTILDVGNILNTTTDFTDSSSQMDCDQDNEGKIVGFHFSSLAKLHATKSFDKSTTLLQYLVQHWAQHDPQIIRGCLQDDDDGQPKLMSLLEAGVKIAPTSFQTEIQEFQRQLQVYQVQCQVMDCFTTNNNNNNTTFIRLVETQLEEMQSLLASLEKDALDLLSYFGYPVEENNNDDHLSCLSSVAEIVQQLYQFLVQLLACVARTTPR